MNILTVENETYNIDNIPNEIDDIRFCVLDCSDTQNIDYFFLPLVFLESFHAPAAVLQIGKFTIQMPLEWLVLVCDPDTSDIEIMELTKLNDRGFEVLSFNPLTDFTSNTEEIKIINVYSEVKWFFPKLKNGCMLVVPLEDKPKPKCAIFVKELSKLPKNLDISDLV